MVATSQLDEVLEPVAAWARSRSDVSGLAVVGSWASGTPRPDSDIDLMLLVPEPQGFRSDQRWPAEIPWSERRVVDWRDVQYGRAWSRHVRLDPHTEIEFTFCEPSWAAINPVDPGTTTVVAQGCRVLVDKAQLFKNLLAAVSP